jgi:hypothetical protein
MESSTRTVIVSSVVTTVVTLVGTVILAVATGAWAGKENASDHRSDMQALVAAVTRVKDVVCYDHQRAPLCQERAP